MTLAWRAAVIGLLVWIILKLEAIREQLFYLNANFAMGF